MFNVMYQGQIKHKINERNNAILIANHIYIYKDEKCIK